MLGLRGRILCAPTQRPDMFVGAHIVRPPAFRIENKTAQRAVLFLFWGYGMAQNSIFCSSQAFSSLMGIRTCSMVSRSRTVTQLSASSVSLPTVWKSTVTQ